MNEQVHGDVLTPTLAARFLGTFDRPLGGEYAPQGIHWCLNTPETATQGLGEDGHPAGGGGFLPASALPRRMWVSSEIAFLQPLRVGAAVERHSRVLSAEEKTGRNGALLFVTVAHETRSEGQVAVRETQTIVYRAAVEPGAAPALQPKLATDVGNGWPWRRELIPSPLLLFRFSALTFNSHRIHYDLPYAREVEGYPGLVVHGPLMATLLLDLADRELGPNRLSRFAFRAQSPAFADERLTLVGRSLDGTASLAVLGVDGRPIMTADAAIHGV